MPETLFSGFQGYGEDGVRADLRRPNQTGDPNAPVFGALDPTVYHQALFKNKIFHWFNPAAFTNAPDCRNQSVLNTLSSPLVCFGNLGRNTFRGPYQQNWDFSLLKNFRLTERFSLRFATDFFNIWNHANFANPPINDVETITHDTLNNPTKDGPFGKIFSTVGTPRLIQFSLRLAF